MIRTKLTSILLVSLLSLVVGGHASAEPSSQSTSAKKALVSSKANVNKSSNKKEPLSLSSLLVPVNPNSPIDSSLVYYTFSGPVTSTPNTINFIRLCMATDDTCQSCEESYLRVDTGTPIPYTNAGKKYSISSEAIASYLSGFTSDPGNYNVGMYVQSELQTCSGDNYCSTKKDNSTPDAKLLCMQAAYDGAVVTALAQSDNGNAVLDTSTNLAYVPDFNSFNIYQCMLNTFTNGTFQSYGCITMQPDPAFGTVRTVSFAFMDDFTQYAYIADGEGNVYYCSLFKDGMFNECKLTPTNGAPSWAPFGVSFTRTNSNIQYAYVADSGVGTVYKCSLNSDGSFVDGGCVTTGPSGAATSVGFTNVNITQYAYVTQPNANTVYKCVVDNNGDLTGCVSAGGPGSWSPISITFATVAETKSAYVSDTNGNVYQCSLASNGSFDTCDITPTIGNPGWIPFAVDFATTASSTKYAYVADNAGSNPGVYQCSLNNNGSFADGSCALTPSVGSPAWAPFGIVFASLYNP